MAETTAPAFYASTRGRRGDWWTLLHPPYTAWHLAYVAVGAGLAPEVEITALVGTFGAFFLAVGISAHALDELKGRPLRTSISSRALVIAGVVGLAGALGIGAGGVMRLGPGLLPFIALGSFLVLAYSLELFGSRFHSDWWFAAAWGAFPVLTAFFAQAKTIRPSAAVAAVAAYFLARAQRTLSTPARAIRRKTTEFTGHMKMSDGTSTPISGKTFLAPLESALRALSWATVALGAAMLLSRLYG